MVTAKDVQGVMAMMPSFSKDARELTSKNTIEVEKLKARVDRIINVVMNVWTPGPRR